MDVAPVVLSGWTVRLEPLTRQHADGLLRAAGHDEIWTYLDEPTPATLNDAERLIDEAQDEYATGARLPFAVIRRDSGEVVGSVSLIDIRRHDRSVEIGWMWLTPAVWRTGVARESVYLLMRHAFETLGAIRVAYKTDSRNLPSQRLILDMGGTQEGTFRNHRILSDGYVRDSIYYSVIPAEWRIVRNRFEGRQANRTRVS